MRTAGEEEKGSKGERAGTEHPEVVHHPQLPLTLRASVGSAPRKGLPRKGKVSTLLCWGCAVTQKSQQRWFVSASVYPDSAGESSTAHRDKSSLILQKQKQKLNK